MYTLPVPIYSVNCYINILPYWYTIMSTLNIDPSACRGITSFTNSAAQCDNIWLQNTYMCCCHAHAHVQTHFFVSAMQLMTRRYDMNVQNTCMCAVVCSCLWANCCKSRCRNFSHKFNTKLFFGTMRFFRNFLINVCWPATRWTGLDQDTSHWLWQPVEKCCNAPSTVPSDC